MQAHTNNAHVAGSVLSLTLDQAWFAGAWLASVITTALNNDVGPRSPHHDDML